EAGEDLVGLLLVARQLDRDVWRAAGDGRLDPLLVLAVPELHQRLVVESQPRDAATLCGMNERRGRRTERPALCEANELIASLREAPFRGYAPRGTQLRRQQRTQQAQPQLTGGNALITLHILVDHGVDAGHRRAARLAEGHRLAGNVLQLDRHVLEHVPEPGALALAHAAQEAAGLGIGAAMLGESRECLGECTDEPLAEARGWPRLECAEIELQANDREARVQRGTDVHGTIEDAHGVARRSS